LIAIFALSEWNQQESALSIVPLAGLFIVYVAFIPRTVEGSLNRFLPLVDIDEAIVPLAWRAVVVLVVALGAQTVAFGLPSINIAPMLLPLGLAKALSWYFTIRTVCCPPSVYKFSELTASRLEILLGLLPRQ
jgi:hypothetical protein